MWILVLILSVFYFISQNKYKEQSNMAVERSKFFLQKQIPFRQNEALEKQFETGHQFLLILDENKALGFAGFELSYDTTNTKLHKLYVLPETQGKGLGVVLLNAVERAANAANQQSIILNVNRYNKAFDFYKKHGFEVICREDIDIGNGYFMNDYVMEKKLD